MVILVLYRRVDHQHVEKEVKNRTGRCESDKRNIEHWLLVPVVEREVGFVLPKRPGIQTRLPRDASCRSQTQLVFEFPERFNRARVGTLDAEILETLDFERRWTLTEPKADVVIRVAIET